MDGGRLERTRKGNGEKSEMNFVTIDFETGKNSRESAISIGLVKFIDGKKVDSFYSLIKPPVMYIRPDFTEIHGLTVEDVKDAPIFPQIWESAVKPFIGDLPLVAHNSPFDMSVLRGVLDWYEMDVPDYESYDTLRLSRAVWKLDSYRLTDLGKHFGITYDAHNALEDSETCGKVLLLAKEELVRQGRVTADAGVREVFEGE